MLIGLFFDEKGFVLSNATIILDDSFYVVVKIALIFISDLTRYTLQIEF